MEFCQSHWDRLREAVEARGLGALIAESGEQAARNFEREVNEGRSVDSFDPLMTAHWMIVQHGSELANYPLIFLEGCPLCWLNEEHERTCKGCSLPRVNGFDGWIDKAADTALKAWQELGT